MKYQDGSQLRIPDLKLFRGQKRHSSSSSRQQQLLFGQARSPFKPHQNFVHQYTSPDKFKLKAEQYLRKNKDSPDRIPASYAKTRQPPIFKSSSIYTRKPCECQKQALTYRQNADQQQLFLNQLGQDRPKRQKKTINTQTLNQKPVFTKNIEQLRHTHTASIENTQIQIDNKVLAPYWQDLYDMRSKQWQLRLRNQYRQWDQQQISSTQSILIDLSPLQTAKQNYLRTQMEIIQKLQRIIQKNTQAQHKT